MNSRSIFDLSSREMLLEQLQKEAENPGIWDDPTSAQRLMKRIADLREEIEGWNQFLKRCQDGLELAESEDESLREDLEKEISALEKELQQRELTTLLSGPYDHENALLTINAGAGGTDSQDWASMLMRMYLRWCERRGFDSEILDFSEGEEAGIKSVTIAVTGPYAYGYLRGEKGVHRLVRLSPFDAAHRRHTSFAQVEVLPEISNGDNEIQINPDDLRIDIYRSSSAGGQNVQKNATAVRITHIPTGIVVSCQNERSQMQNRENAMRVLRARLAELKRQEQERQLAELRGEYIKAEWGSQIRSYVLHPYQLVKDHRTEYETGNTQAVLDGELDGFIEAYLRSQKTKSGGL
ncbi:peptide chain release factor 2 [Anaerolinea thermophila UNI-1]|uniref:Peptide chain release factor 2 n=1 Tax=Anaerolinea thermophila (strain DSM 14523 / JCM 11388 / NBRC 100420 / UNI-1) TaxID=926569 RepID=E8N5H7_ANATU|nr:peptide chain release factor 2 [Anaerolinea thermophila UNI-1]